MKEAYKVEVILRVYKKNILSKSPIILVQILLNKRKVIFFTMQAKYVANHYFRTHIPFQTPCFRAEVIQETIIKVRELLKVAGVHQGLALHTSCLIFRKNITLHELWLWQTKNNQSGVDHTP